MRKSIGEKIFIVANTVIMVLLCIVSVYPYLNQLALSLNDGMDAIRGGLTMHPNAFDLHRIYRETRPYRQTDIGQ